MQIADRADREATLSTVQVDFYQPDRFDLNYVGADGAKHRPRSVIGSLERVVAHLIEVSGGAFPAWPDRMPAAWPPVSDRTGWCPIRR